MYAIAQFRYFKILRNTIDIATRLREINHTNSIVYSPDPRAEVNCLTLNFKISKLGYCYNSEEILKIYIFQVAEQNIDNTCTRA